MMGISFKGLVVGLALGGWVSGSLLVSEALARDGNVITEVEIQKKEGGGTRIILRGAEDPIYTAFMRENPRRLIIELPDVIFEGVDSPLQVRDGLVKDVILVAFGDPKISPAMARVSIGLERAVEMEVIPEGDELRIELRPLGGNQMAAAAQTSASPASAMKSEPAPPAKPAPVVKPEPVPAARAPSPVKEPTPVTKIVSASEVRQAAQVREPKPAAKPAAKSAAKPAPKPAMKSAAKPAPKPATKTAKKAAAGRILKVTARKGQIYVRSDGPIDNVDAFTLSNPDRLVVDFWGVRSSASPSKFKVADGLVKGVRIGQHPKKVRVVLDLRRPIGSHELKVTDEGVHILLHAGKDAEQAQHGTRASKHATQVESVHFESLPGVDRVVLSIGRELGTKVYKPDPGTVVIDLADARITADTGRRVDTTDFGGPLEMFAVFQTPDVPDDRVRIVLKRRGADDPRLTWKEGQLHIELPRKPADVAVSRPRGPVPAASAQPTVDAAPASVVAALAGSPAPPDPFPRAPAMASTPATVSLPARVPAPVAIFGDDPLLAGPADPAAIDILEEGGFSEDKTYEGRRISLDFKDADIANILRLIAEVSDLNIIAGEEVQGKVTIRLVDVPWDQAMDVILLTRGLGFVRVGNVLRIAPLETLKLEQEARLMERRSREKLEDLVLKLQPVNYANVKETKMLIQRLLSPRGSVNMDERTNTLIIKDIPSVIAESTALIRAIDTQTPQVLIEAKIVEASLNFTRSLGASWGAGFNSASNRKGGSDRLRLADSSLDALISVPDGNQQSNFISSNPVSGILNGILTLGILGLEEGLQLDLMLMAAESNNRGKVISSPRVVTLDNREAVIKQGVAIKFTEITRDTVTTSFVDAVLELKVTPHITANRSIIMKLKVSRNAPQLSSSSGDIVGITKNETETEALVRDGETMVLGGIYVVDSGKTRTKLPFLADIPLIGALFRSYSIQDERRELLIFVTPRIVRNPSAEI